jgi:hypothetical protein
VPTGTTQQGVLTHCLQGAQDIGRSCISGGGESSSRQAIEQHVIRHLEEAKLTLPVLRELLEAEMTRRWLLARHDQR